MAAISRSNLQKELVPGLNALFGLEYKKYQEEWRKIFDSNTSDRSFEEELKLVGFGTASVKPEGQGVTFDTAQEAWVARYNHQTIAMGFIITQEAIEDNLYADVGRRYTKALSRSMAYTKNIKGAAVLNSAFDTNVKGGDAVCLCSASHPLSNGATLSNTATADLNETSLEAAFIQIGKWTDERGLLISARPNSAVLPIDLSFVMERLMKSQLRVATNNNDINAARSMGLLPGGWDINHFLTDTNAWFLKTDVPDGLKHFQRVALATGQEGDFDTGNMKYKARERYCFGWTDPLGVWGSPGA